MTSCYLWIITQYFHLNISEVFIGMRNKKDATGNWNYFKCWTIFLFNLLQRIPSRKGTTYDTIQNGDDLTSLYMYSIYRRRSLRRKRSAIGWEGTPIWGTCNHSSTNRNAARTRVYWRKDYAIWWILKIIIDSFQIAFQCIHSAWCISHSLH